MGKEQFTKYNIARTEQLLRTHGFKIDKFDGVVSTIGGDSTASGNGITLHMREVINSFTRYDNAIAFDYNSSKGYTFGFPRKAPKTKTFEEWFDIFEGFAMMLACETWTGSILVSSGRKDKAFLESKGYTKKDGFFRKDLPATYTKRTDTKQPNTIEPNRGANT